jgi:hypothetical protein
LTENSTAKTASPAPSQSGFPSFGSAPGSQSITPQPQFQTPSQSAFSPPPPSNDPFAFLSGSKSPAQQPSPAPAPAPVATASNDDDEWNFASALPPEAPSKPKEHRGTVSNTNVRIEFIAARTAQASNALNMKFAFSNNTPLPVSELHFQLAVTKVRKISLPITLKEEEAIKKKLHCQRKYTNSFNQGYELQLKPQTGRTLNPNQARGITQEVDVFHAGNKTLKVDAVKLRWRMAYQVGGQPKSEMGEIPEFSIA